MRVSPAVIEFTASFIAVRALVGGDEQFVFVAFSLSRSAPLVRVCQLRWKAVSTQWSGRLTLSSLGTLLSSSILMLRELQISD